MSSTPAWLDRWLTRTGTLGALFRVVGGGGRWWMVPVVVALAGVGVLLVVLESFQYVAPFVYAVF